MKTRRRVQLAVVVQCTVTALITSGSGKVTNIPAISALCCTKNRGRARALDRASGYAMIDAMATGEQHSLRTEMHRNSDVIIPRLRGYP